MKKILILAMAALALFSCKKNGESTKPQIAWEGNASFSEQEIGASMDAKVVVNFPEGLESLQVKCSSLPAEIKGIITPWIGISANKSTMLLDLLDDATLASKLGAYVSPVGSGLKKATSCTIDFAKLMLDLTEGQVLPANSKFIFDITLKDAKGEVLSRSVKFRFTPAPIFPDGVPASYQLVKNDTRTLEWRISIPGKTESFTIDFGGEKADAGIINYIKQRNEDKTTIDLVNDANVNTAFSLDPVAMGATGTTLKLSNLMKEFGYVATAGSETVMTVKISDQLGKESVHIVKLTVAVQ